jgi:hypothetical protein
MHDRKEVETPEEPQQESASEETASVGSVPPASVPVGIARIREEWRGAGLTMDTSAKPASEQVEPVVFSEIDGGAGIGDYTLEYESVIERLGLASEAVDRLLASGELDSILLQSAGGLPRRLISQSSFERFRQDSAMDPEAIKRAARAMADQTLVASIDDLRAEIEELKSTQGKVLQQMKDTLLLELRNLKEQDRDLTSFVYELAEEVRAAMPKKKKG